MKTGGLVRKGAYFDSVTLMGIGRHLLALAGVDDASVVMGTDTNRSLLKSAGLLLPAFAGAGDGDLIMAVRAANGAALENALRKAEELLKRRPATSPIGGATPAVGSLDAALRALPGANLALISVAGRYAAEEARKAIESGLHVMLFSDNVPIEAEVELKRLAQRTGLLVMGPDAGTAILNGVPLAFANVVERGPVGIVAASGTGAQEISTLVSNQGVGISHLIGVGGRDVKKAVGGVMFLEAMKALIADAQTTTLVLVSKPPDTSVLRKIQALAAKARKPVVRMFLGAAPRQGDPRTLEEAAALAVALAQGRPASAAWEALKGQRLSLREEAARAKVAPPKRGGHIRGLFSGGTFCAEAQVILRPILGKVYSNAPTAGGVRLADAAKSRGHTFLDLGEDEFTRGRAHPMIDLTLRNERILREVRDPATGLLILDVVLGYGAHPDPASELAPVVREAARRVPVLCSVTGTNRDPQDRAATLAKLRAAGAFVAPSNAAACRLAGDLMQERRR